jgi:DivIVA domain-containing protein
MEMSPQTVRSTGFRVVKKGYDPAEVDAFKEQVASAVEYTQNQATAMEARARAAVAKLQEMSQQMAANAQEAAVPTAAPAAAPVGAGDHEVISRTLLLAQRTADTTVAEARLEADQILAQARDEAGRVLDNARTMGAKTLEDARYEARRSVEDEKVRAENEVQALLARRDFLLSDVDHLEQYVIAQRDRVRDAAVQLQELVDRVPGGLGDMRRPLLSASADPLPSELQPIAAEAAPQVEPAPFVPEPSPSESGSLASMALSSDPEAKDSVWRLLDEEVAHTQTSLDLPSSSSPSSGSSSADDDTAEHRIHAAEPVEDDPFHIAGEELQ